MEPQDIFQEFSTIFEQNGVAEQVVIEPALSAFVVEGEMVSVPGVQIELSHPNMPLFFTIQDLRDLADAAESYILNIASQQNTPPSISRG